MLAIVPQLCDGMVEIAYQRRLLQTTLACIHFNQCLVQGLWTTNNPLQQLPHFTEEELKHVNRGKTQTKSLADYLRLPDSEKKGLSKLSEEQRNDVFRVAKLLPCIKVWGGYNADIEGKTLRGNVNGGVYTMDKKSFDNIHEAWYNWALWCIERRQSFGNHYMFIDQVAFSMALASEKMEYKELDRRFNFSINPRIRKEMDCHPSIIHYNNFYDENFNLNNLPSEFEKCNETIGFLNEQWNYGMEKLS